MTTFTKILIANRGEIACRIMRTARRMGIATVAVYSDADRDALHVAMADEAVRIGPPPARDSYLRGDVIIAAAKRSGAQAIHPGYGFLSENAEFAEACAVAGLIFIGPSPETMRLMGSKSAAKTLMEKSGVPLVPGYHGSAQHLGALRETAERIGYPVLIKASAGGGGKGMRVVTREADFAEALAGAKREAKAAFADDRMLIEKYLSRPRHIEVQVFGDAHGNIVSLFERECTLQRRHQKVIEEAPSPSLTPEQLERIWQAAREAAKAVNYINAGTVEFIADAENFYFIEMNTRLQVEHPVTEMITGIDLVAWQIRVAMGEAFTRTQDQIKARGHAIEARVYAEDPDKGFLPSIGTLHHWKVPDLRVDSGYRQGDTITPHYDPMLAKMIAAAPTRAQALRQMMEGLKHFEVAGIATNIAFLEKLIAHPDVVSDRMDTGLIERDLAMLTAPASFGPLDLAAAAGAAMLRERRPPPSDGWRDPWDDDDGWMPAGERRRTYSFRHAGQRHDIVVARQSLGATARDGSAFDVVQDGEKEQASAVWLGRDLELLTARGRFKLHWIDPYAAEAGSAISDDRIVAPMPGTVTRILAEAGAELARGAAVLVLEAMKMEHTLRAPADGRLVALNCAVGDVVSEGTDLADFEPVRSGPQP